MFKRNLKTGGQARIYFAFLGVALLVASTDSFAEPAYNILDLGTLGGVTSFANDGQTYGSVLNNLGQAVGNFVWYVSRSQFSRAGSGLLQPRRSHCHWLACCADIEPGLPNAIVARLVATISVPRLVAVLSVERRRRRRYETTRPLKGGVGQSYSQAARTDLSVLLCPSFLVLEVYRRTA